MNGIARNVTNTNNVFPDRNDLTDSSIIKSYKEKHDKKKGMQLHPFLLSKYVYLTLSLRPLPALNPGALEAAI